MKKCIFAMLLVTSCVIQSRGFALVGLLRNYKDACTRLARVDQSNYMHALEGSRDIGFEIQHYESALNRAGITDYNPFKDSPEDYVERLSDEQIEKATNRLI